MTKRITILGATGSVGRTTLDLVADHPEQFRIVALTANRDAGGLAAAARRFGAERAVVADPGCYAALKEALAGSGIEAAAGPAAVCEAAGMSADIVVSAIVGAAGLKPTLAAIEAGIPVALANKETLVCAGEIVLQATARSGVRLLPVDSEHSAIFQVFAPEERRAVERLILTASGGPFRDAPISVMARATAADAVKHPVWSMGAKISIDSATMMNKGLEVIEAHFLFAMPEERIDIVVHPQSVVHSLVEYQDGSVLAHLGNPDMRTPVAVALAWPKRLETRCKRLDLAAIGKLTFEPADPVKFPAIRLAREALRARGAAPTVLNAANEVAVAAFLGNRIGFLDIAAIVERTLEAGPTGALNSLDDVLQADETARRIAASFVTASDASLAPQVAASAG